MENRLLVDIRTKGICHHDIQLDLWHEQSGSILSPVQFYYRMDAQFDNSDCELRIGTHGASTFAYLITRYRPRYAILKLIYFKIVFFFFLKETKRHFKSRYIKLFLYKFKALKV